MEVDHVHKALAGKDIACLQIAALRAIKEGVRQKVSSTHAAPAQRPEFAIAAAEACSIEDTTVAARRHLGAAVTSPGPLTR